ncbi:MAG: hypothetical protein JJE21_03385 [Spirochaetaceae bacterium]|nr:hypothetical protein [Spirochaetaceae bacterium]
MNLFFKENIKLKKILNIIILLICVIYAWIIYYKNGAIQATVMTLVLFIILEVIIFFVVGLRDQKKLNKILTLLYNDITPLIFIKKINEIIDLDILNTTTKIAILSHKANAYAYSGNFEEAYSILDEIDKLAIRKNDKAQILGNRISYQLLENKLDNIDKEMKEFEVFAFADNSKYKFSHKSYKRNYIHQQIHLKIIRKEKLTGSEVNELYESIQTGGNQLNIESLRYYAALFLIRDKDKTGALEQLKKIDLKNEITIIRKKAKVLYKELS